MSKNENSFEQNDISTCYRDYSIQEVIDIDVLQAEIIKYMSNISEAELDEIIEEIRHENLTNLKSADDQTKITSDSAIIYSYSYSSDAEYIEARYQFVQEPANRNKLEELISNTTDTNVNGQTSAQEDMLFLNFN